LPAEQAALVKMAFNVTSDGTFEHGASVLEAKKELKELAARSGKSGWRSGLSKMYRLNVGTQS